MSTTFTKSGRQIEACDFKLTQAKAKRMSIDELRYSIKDTLEAAHAADEFDRLGMPNNSGRYWDEYYTFSDELTKRMKKKG